ncbi:MAG: SRPBCC family protein [Myxococcota bacterium]
MAEPIHHEIVFPVSRERVYQALLDEAQHAEFTGGPAEISPDAGGAFSCHGGQIVGRNIELVPNERIVQAWRVANWPPGVYSVVSFRFETEGEDTRLVLDHHGVPADAREHIDGGWHQRYWEPMKKFLA